MVSASREISAKGAPDAASSSRSDAAGAFMSIFRRGGGRPTKKKDRPGGGLSSRAATAYTVGHQAERANMRRNYHSACAGSGVRRVGGAWALVIRRAFGRCAA
ncbi:hypothetical protein GCM10009532_27920 [Microbacterium aurantiacum]